MAAAEPLADVVKHESQIEQLAFLRLARQLGEKRQRFLVFARFQALDLFDQSQGMLVDGINMIGVVENHAKQPAKLRNKGTEHSTTVHLQQGLVHSVLPFENLKERNIGRRRPAKSLVNQI